MKKILLFLAMAFLILPMVLAISVDVEKTSSKDVLIRDVNLPVIVSLDVTNNGEGDSFQFVNLLGFPMLPVEAVQIGPGETKEVKLTIYPRENFNYLGFYKFEYNIIGSDSSIVTENFILNMIELSDAFEVGSEEFNENESQIKLYIENKNNFNFGEIHAKFYSPFFEFEEDFEIGAFEKVEFDVDLKKEDFEKVMAGFYTLEVEIDIDGEVADFEGLINFEELDSLITRDRDFGWLIDTRIVEKINEGNIISSAEVVLNKNILSRLFTSLSPDPYSVDRDGLSVEYTWKTVLNPGERLEVVVKTNWLFPLLIIILVVGIVAFARKYSKTNVVLRKKVSFVKAKGGEFALKVSIFVKARKYVEDVRVIDRLPGLVKLYERFGIEKPKKIDAKNRKIEWEFEKLEAGESRVLNYIIYSKVGVLGRFALPSTVAMYKREGENKEGESNRAFFMAEQKK